MYSLTRVTNKVVIDEGKDTVLYDEELVYSEVEFTPNTFNIKTYAVDGNRLIDEYTIEKTDFTYSDIDTSENLFDTDALDRVLSHFMGDYYVIYVKVTEVIKFLLNTVKTVIG